MAKNEQKPRYRVRPVTTPTAPGASREHAPEVDDPFIRPPREDDDGYDPYSDRPPTPESPYQEDPWR